MSQLTVRDVPESLVKKLQRRAVEHGVSEEEEHRCILREALSKSAATTKKRTLFDAFRELGRIAPDFQFERKRTRSKRPPVKF